MHRLPATLISVVVLLVADFASAQRSMHLTLQSPPGESIGAGRNWDAVYTDANTVFFNVSLYAYNGSALPNYLIIGAMHSPVSTNYLHAQFGTNYIGQELRAGSYLDAQRAPFADPGHPGLDISFQHRGSNTLIGSFDINNISYHREGSDWVLDGLDVSFFQRSEGAPLAMTGTISYSVPEPLGLTSVATTLAISTLSGRQRKTRRLSDYRQRSSGTP